MEIADDVQWNGDAEERLIERAIAKNHWGQTNGYKNLGRRLIIEVTNKIEEIRNNINLYEERDDSERVAPLASSKCVLVYKKEYFTYTDSGSTKVRLLILDVRKSY